MKFQHEGFLFIDVQNKSIQYCDEFYRHHNILKSIKEKWPLWDINEHNLGMYRHASLCSLPWQEYVMSEEDSLNCIRESFLHESKFDPANTLKAISKESDNIQVNPYFFQKAKPGITLAEKTQLLDEVIAIWGSSENYYEKALTCEIW